MIECKSCTTPAELYLCGGCQNELQKMLTELTTGPTPTTPGLLENLQDTHIGQTRLGEPARHTRYATFELDRDEILDKVADETNIKLLRSFLTVGGVNGYASDLNTQIHHTLKVWAEGLAKTHGVMLGPPLNWHKPPGQYRHTTADYAAWLAANVHLIARDEDAGAFHRTIRNYIRNIKKAIDLRQPPVFCGPCPTQITDHTHCKLCTRLHRHDCGTRLMARRGAVETICPFCKTTHNIETLINELLSRAGHFRCTIQDLHDVLVMLDERVPIRTLQDWAARGWLQPRGYIRPDGYIGLTRRDDDDRPVYRLSEARKLRTEPKLTPEQRTNRARKAAQTRWARKENTA